MSTFSVPFYHAREGRRRFWGIVTADVSLEWLKGVVSSVKIYQHGYAFLISKNGDFVTHPEQGLIMRESLFSLAEARNDDALRRVGREMIRGGEGFVPIRDFVSGRPSWLYYASLPSNGWALGVIFPEDELFADIRHLGQTVFVIGVAGFVFLGLFVALISGTITHPLRSLAQTTSEIARGNLDIDLPDVPRNDEVGRLTRSFKEMRVALKEYISHLAETTAAKERIESELKIARTIQMSFLPKRFPPFPGKESFEIYAALEPAKEVGGDLYDFFLVGEDRLFFTLGDVSGKGVPAALFMAVTKTLLKGLAETGMSPSDVLAQVNVELSHENDSMMFVTVFCGFLDLRTGELFYSNAGHVRPLIIRGGSGPDWLRLPPGVVLGTTEKASYRTERVVLQPGDSLFAYTDGVTEAINGKQDFFSGDSLLRTVRSNASCCCEELVKTVMWAVKAFAGGTPQSDDIAILALCYKGER
jgi:sigma-B regulation protein RsbU (phosphoserine phosphatase)